MTPAELIITTSDDGEIAWLILDEDLREITRYTTRNDADPLFADILAAYPQRPRPITRDDLALAFVFCPALEHGRRAEDQSALARARYLAQSVRDFRALLRCVPPEGRRKK